MGYWSTHPMGGDPPSDVVYVLDDLLFTKEERENEKHWDNNEYKKRLTEKLEEATKLEYRRGAKNDLERQRSIKYIKEKVEPFYPQIAENMYRSITEDCSFVLPFKVIEHEVKIEDKKLSKTIKDMIKDGGAYERGYDIPKETEENYPTESNNWNNLESPFDYARKLHDLWEPIMDGEIPFKSMEEDIGLFGTIIEAYEENDGKHPGTINKK